MNQSIFTKKIIPATIGLIVASAYAASDKGDVNLEKTQPSVEKAPQKLKSVINFDFDKIYNDNLSVIAIPESKEIVIDMEKSSKDFTIPKSPENDPLIENISTKMVNEKLKMVIKVKKEVGFKIAQSDRFATIVLEESDVFKNLKTGKTFAKLITEVPNGSFVKTEKNEKTKSSFNELNKINIKKINNKDSKITIELLNKFDIPEVKKDKGSLIISFKNTAVSSTLQKTNDVSSAGTITKTIEVSENKGNAKFIIANTGGWEYSTYQIENKFVIETKEAGEEAEEKYTGKKLSISFQDMEVRAILQVLADFTGLNILSSDQVQGSMSIRLKDVPWDQALDLVLESRGLQQVKSGNAIWVATKKEIEDNNNSKIALLNQNTQLEPLRLEFFQINHYNASELKDVLEAKADATNQSASTTPSIKFLSSRGSIGLDSRRNVLFIQDTDEKLKEIKKIIKRLDVANKQVVVEAKIVIADKKFGQDIGTRFGVKYRQQNGNSALGISNNFNSAASLASANSTTAGAANTFLDAANVNGSVPGAIGLTLLNMATGNSLGIELSALEDNSRGKVLSSPRILTADNKKATIEQGSEIPYVTPGTNGSPATVAFKKAVLKLDVTPQISPNGKVALNLQISKDSIGQLVPVAGGGTVPSIDTKKIDTLVTVNNGQTVVLGGVYEIQNNEDLQKIPLLGDIPLLGNLFQRNIKSENKGELMIFITPFIVENSDLDPNDTSDGQEITLTK